MKHLSRATLKLLAVLTPAAWGCGVLTAQPAYGVPVRITNGKVVVRTSQAPVRGIQVTCLTGAAATPGESTTTDDKGSFSLETYGECDVVRAEDVDGAANGGPFRTATAEPVRNYVTIELDE